MKSTKRLGLCLMLSLIPGCVSTSVNDCSWAVVIETSQEDNLTRQTKEQIVSHNEKVDSFCK